jgi:hypothetical protein
MKRATAILVVLVLAGCTWWEDDVEPTELTVRSVELGGTLPASTGTITVLVDGQAATVTGTTWSATIHLRAAQTSVPVVLLLDGVAVARRQVAVEL